MKICFLRNEEEQNMVAYQFKGEILYKTYKDVKPGQELLVWYGDQYANHLGIPTKFKNKIQNDLKVKKLEINPEVLARGDFKILFLYNFL